MGMNDDLIEDVRTAIRNAGATPLEDAVGQMSPAEWARVVSRLPDYEMPLALRQLSDDLMPQVVAEMDAGIGARIVQRLTRSEGADLLSAMDPDDATDLIVKLSAGTADQILERMTPESAGRIRQLIAYPSDSAGGRMTPEFVALVPELTADQAIAAIRAAAKTFETTYYTYVVDEAERFCGVISLHELVIAPPETPVRSLMVTNPVSVRVDTDQEDAARLLIQRNLLAIPVLDSDDRLVGIITEDDVADVLVEEATEDIERLGGSQPLETPYRHASIFLLFRKRIVWLLALFVAEAYTGSVMRIFEDELAQVVALAFFIPLLLGTGGNIGSQITTTLVRAMAVEELSLRDARWVLGKEAGVGIVIGGVMAAVAFGRAEILGVGSDVAMVVAITIAVISLWSSLVAAVLPMVLRRLKFDPTVVSAPFITTLVDGTGLVIYFSIAKVVLDL